MLITVLKTGHLDLTFRAHHVCTHSRCQEARSMLVFIPGMRRRRRVEVTDAEVVAIPANTLDHSRDWKHLGQEPPVSANAGKTYVVRYVRYGDGRRTTEVLALDGYWYEIDEGALLPQVCLFTPREW